MGDDRLVELAATNLGVIERLSLLLEPGMTAITGETGAGKTLLVTALDLLTGGRADSAVVGPHDDEAVVEGRFVYQGDELVLRRVVPRDGRSRAYVNGGLATASTLAEYGAEIVELHGQHGHTALTATAAQRAALDLYGGVDVEPLVQARIRERELADELAGTGGDERTRLRDLELVRHQVAEIDAAAVTDGDEDARLREEEELLGGATAHREAALLAVERLGSDGPAELALGEVLAGVEGAGVFEELSKRLRDLSAELADVATEARELVDRIQDDPEHLVEIQERRRVLTDLRRRYGDSLADVLSYRDEAAERLEALENHEQVAAALEAELEQARQDVVRSGGEVGAARRKAAPGLAEEVVENVRGLALPNATMECRVGPDPGDEVELLVSMNKGAPPQPLAKIASGGELARTMLALRLVLSAEPATMVFDEVDAGVGGAAAQAVGAALGRLGAQSQVLVVTHLPQVAAYADNHVTVVKDDSGGMVSVTASVLDTESRIVELSRMLSGSPASQSARDHAAELLREVADSSL